MALNSIEAEWNAFAAMVLGPKYSETQHAEMKKAFFAGAWTMFCATEEIGEPHITEEVACAYLVARRAECLAFKQRLMAEYSERN